MIDPVPVIMPESSSTVTPRRSLVFLVGSLAGGNVVAMVLRMVAGVLVGRLVAPAALGLFNGIGLVLGYAPFLQLGVLSGMNRELPFYAGKGDYQRVEELAAAAQAWALAVGSGACLVLLGIAGWRLVHGEPWEAAGWFTNAILVVFVFYNSHYLQMTYRTSHDFARLAMVNVVESIVGLVLLALVWLLDFYGLCLRAVLTGVIASAVLFHFRPLRVGPKWNLRHLKHLLIIGAPILGVATLYSWWTVINSTLVLRYAGTHGMGLYSMVTVAITALELIPMAVSQVVYPRLSEQYGRNGSVRGLVRVAIKPMMITAAGMIPLTVAAWWLVGPAVRFVVPAYADAVPAMRWGLLLPIVTSFQPLNSIFNVVRRQDLYSVALVLGLAVNGGSLAWLIRDGVTLTAFPQAMLIGRGLFMVACYLLVVYLARRSSRT